MITSKAAFKDMIPEIDPERVVRAQFGPNGLLPLDSPTQARSLKCYGCGGQIGYFNLAWDAWCCRNEACWGTPPKSEASAAFRPPREIIRGLEDIGVPEKYQGCRLSDCYQTTHKIEHFREWAKKPKGFLIFSGNSGSGKTFSAYAILHEYLQNKKHDARFFNVADLYFEYRAEVAERGSASNLIAKFSDCELLLMDDLGQRTPTDAYLEFLYVLINKRYETNKATIVTTNLNGEGLEKRLGEAITSRILSGQNHYFDGKDRRLANSKTQKIESIK